jgi:hypothetical protein
LSLDEWDGITKLCDSSHPAVSQAWSVGMQTKGDVMGREARLGLLLGASACLLAVMVDWVVEELNGHEKSQSG